MISTRQLPRPFPVLDKPFTSYGAACGSSSEQCELLAVRGAAMEEAVGDGTSGEGSHVVVLIWSPLDKESPVLS